MAESEEALGEFLVHLKLFNTLVSNSSFEKASELADLFLNTFLMDFILPSVQDVRLCSCVNLWQLFHRFPQFVRRILNLSHYCHLLRISSELHVRILTSLYWFGK